MRIVSILIATSIFVRLLAGCQSTSSPSTRNDVEDPVLTEAKVACAKPLAKNVSKLLSYVTDRATLTAIDSVDQYVVTLKVRGGGGELPQRVLSEVKEAHPIAAIMKDGRPLEYAVEYAVTSSPPGMSGSKTLRFGDLSAWVKHDKEGLCLNSGLRALPVTLPITDALLEDSGAELLISYKLFGKDVEWKLNARNLRKVDENSDLHSTTILVPATQPVSVSMSLKIYKPGSPKVHGPKQAQVVPTTVSLDMTFP